MTKQDFIFNNRFPQRLYRHIAFWVVYYLFSLVTYFHAYLEKTGFRKWALLQVIEVFCNVATQMFFCYIVLYFLLPKFFSHNRYVAFTAGIIGLSIGVYCLYYFEHITILKAIHSYAGLPFMSTDVLCWFLLISLVTYFPISTGLAIAFKTLKNFYIKKMRINC